MKTSILALAASLTGLAMAAPSVAPVERQSTHYPYSIDTLWLRRYTDNTFRINFSLTRRTDAGEALLSTTCTTTWNPSVPAGPADPVQCADPTYTFWFPTGIRSLLDYEITANGPDGQATGEIVEGPKYACGGYEGDLEGIIYECTITNGGAFYLAAE
ncbi:hypothetical protein BJY01DRAFT_221477 [Aspergillus pseudoustus]|uniref:AA1-like domain-containing protein n=1 Tax=Aspergillus pseudoustus TaxID=1810923 RepID=A0ABR4JCR3_9EURO